MTLLRHYGFAAIAMLTSLTACDFNDERQSEVVVSNGTRLQNVVVEYVKDGDSFTATHDDKKIEVRLFGIDAPERNQPFSQESRRAAVKLLGSAAVTLVVKDTDRYQRIVAEAFLGNQEVSVNQRLVEQGAVWVYRKYSNDSALLSAEQTARKKRIGLWALNESDRLEPWLWRKNEEK